MTDKTRDPSNPSGGSPTLSGHAAVPPDAGDEEQAHREPEAGPEEANKAAIESHVPEKTAGDSQPDTTRRDLLKYGTAGLAAAALGVAGLLNRPSGAEAATRIIKLFINEGDVSMIDGTPVYMWGFGDTRTSLVVRGSKIAGGEFPARVIRAVEGDVLKISVMNTLDENHSFVIPGVVNSGVIRPKATKQLSFRVPKAGTYIYLDNLNPPVNRVLGLHGVLVVMPRGGGNVPFAGGPRFVRQFVWMLQAVDPVWAELARRNRPINKATCKPRYFMINGRSGVRSVHAADTVPKVRAGEATLIRLVNMSPAVHSPHIHGNHMDVLTHNGRVLPIRMEKDTIMMRPLDRKDCLLPGKPPPDAWPPTNVSSFPMHCHTELSQTAAGGLYPSGMLAHWELVE